ncbi:MAG: flagellar motor protein MotB [Polyangiaceae bacterium]
MRKKKHPEHVNHERWLISYADFITLLFAFFVVMFAVSQVDTKKMGRFTESFSQAVGVEPFTDSGKGILPSAGGKEAEERDSDGHPPRIPSELESFQGALGARAKASPELDALQIVAVGNEVVLRMPVGVIFDNGSDSVKKTASPALQVIADEIRDRPLDLRVEGHTDDRPIATTRFRSNWDLSTGRATAVVLEFARMGIAPARLAAAGYGEFHPLSPNDTAEGRAKNRRVDVVVRLASRPLVGEGAAKP